jgi:hypothetical protein
VIQPCGFATKPGRQAKRRSGQAPPFGSTELAIVEFDIEGIGEAGRRFDALEKRSDRSLRAQT